MKDPSKPCVLVVDDNSHNLLAMESALGTLNVEIFSATSAREALRLVLKHEFVVILLDVKMPDIDGFETARLIRNREKSKYTPIIFLSAWNKDEMDVNKGYEMGAIDYIFKPLNPNILKQKVKVFIDLFTKSTLAVHLQEELKKRLRAEQHSIRQKHQLALAQQERVNVMEEMSSALAHELNQPLTTITNYVRGCIHRLTDEKFDVSSVIGALQHTAQQAERAGAILHRIKDFVRKSKLCLEPISINDLINNIPNLLLEDIQAEKIDINIKPCENHIPPFLLDKIQFEQVIINILKNGIEALKQQFQLTKKQLTIETFLKKQNIVIRIKDNGVGLSSDAINKLFDLYYTTKKNGMGVGLTICRTIVEAHGGSITAFNNPGGGACFQIILPMRTSHA